MLTHLFAKRKLSISVSFCDTEKAMLTCAFIDAWIQVFISQVLDAWYLDSMYLQYID